MNRQYLDGDARALLETARQAMEVGTNRNRLSWAGLGSLLAGDATQTVKYLEHAFRDRDWYQGNFLAAEIVDLANLVVAYRTLGQEQQADEIIEHCEFRIRRLRAQDVWLPDLDYAEGVVHVLRGKSEQGIDFLRRAATRGWLAFPVMEVDPKLKPLRSDDRSISMLQQARQAVSEGSAP